MTGKEQTILDPCAGRGGLEDFSSGIKYTLFDIADYGVGAIIADFLKYEFPNGTTFNAAVINPPFAQTEAFIDKCFKYTSDCYVVAPIKTIASKYGASIVGSVLDYKISTSFGILTSVGLFHLRKPSFGTLRMKKDDVLSKLFLPKAEKTWKDAFIEVEEAPKDRPFLVNRLTKARVIRQEALIQDADIYEAGDQSAFVAVAGNQFREAGSKLKRAIHTFSSIEEAKAFQALYQAQDAYIREYCYQWGNNILRLNEIPLLS
jgi:hypothetical protein